jgi:hypothetical protein
LHRGSMETIKLTAYVGALMAASVLAIVAMAAY